MMSESEREHSHHMYSCTTQPQLNPKLNHVDSNTPRHTITHKLSIVNKAIQQQVPTEESKLHLMHEYLMSSTGKQVQAYHTQQLQLQIPGAAVASMCLCIYVIVCNHVSVCAYG